MKHDDGYKQSEINPTANGNGVSLAANPPVVLTIAPMIFKLGEVVWAKIKGSVHWPARIKSFPSNKMVTVVWFNDYRTTKIYRTQIFKYLLNFDTYAKNFDRVVGLEKAAKEGLILYGEMASR